MPATARRVLATLPLAAWLALASGCQALGGASDPWTAAQLERPAELAAALADTTSPHPMLIHVGFHRLWQAGVIPGSIYAGPGSSEAGLQSLRDAVRDVPRDRAIVIYCGCCPWDHCPNMRPAFRVLRELGFTNARALMIAKNLDADWADAGHPLEKPKD
jgi:rhodanese-related sulfurtransferase